MAGNTGKYHFDHLKVCITYRTIEIWTTRGCFKQFFFVLTKSLGTKNSNFLLF